MKFWEGQRWLAATLSSIADGLIVTDAGAHVRFLNPTAEAITGWTAAEALERPLPEVFALSDEGSGTARDQLVGSVLESGQTLTIWRSLLVARDGREVPVEGHVSPIHDASEQVTGLVLVFRDVSDRLEADRSLRAYTAELQARNEELDAFAHTVAHDLKNPLTNLLGSAAALDELWGVMSETERREYVHTLLVAGQKLDNIVEELLLLAGVRKTDAPLLPLDMDLIVIEALGRLRYLIAESGARIVLPDNWPPALGHAPWIEEVWVNYISNAIQYGGRPPRVELGSEALPNGMVRFWVRDNGAGLAPEAQAHMFAPFTQLAQARARGHGLGLSIVRRIVEKLGGQVSVESRMGQGSTFSFTLPG